MGGQDDIDAVHPCRQLAIHVEAVVRQQHDHLRTPPACIGDGGAQGCSRMPNDQFGIIQRGLAMGV